jgi:hypothetical protein
VDDDCVAPTALFVTADVRGCFQPV